MSQTHEACNNKYKKCPEIPVSLIAAILVHIPVGMAFVVVLLGLAPCGGWKAS